MTSQNARIMYDRVRISCGVSGGGLLFATGAFVAIVDDFVVLLGDCIEEGAVPSSPFSFIIASCPVLSGFTTTGVDVRVGLGCW